MGGGPQHRTARVLGRACPQRRRQLDIALLSVLTSQRTTEGNDKGTPLGSTYRLQLPGIGFAGARARSGTCTSSVSRPSMFRRSSRRRRAARTATTSSTRPARPSLGTPSEFEALLAELAAHGMRLLIDIVPNHMAAASRNRWWWEVLRDGQESAYAEVFDIDWARHDTRVLVPTLSRPLAEPGSEGAPSREPTGPNLNWSSTASGSLCQSRPHRGTVAGHRRPALPAPYWRLSPHEVNYRRFFDIDGLIGVRVEDPAVFELTHRFVARFAQTTGRRGPSRPRGRAQRPWRLSRAPVDRP